MPSEPLLKHKNKDNTQTTHQAKQAHITSSILHVLFFNNGDHPKGKLWMMKGHRIFKPGEIRIFFKKIRKQKP
jgi:hypothetical protein